jgi:hypothetical protein
MRNGTNDYPIGTPQSRGLPVWHVHDDDSYEYLLPFLVKLAPTQETFIRTFLSMKAAA